ncbi:hypothetical protein A2483_04955 [Candidatus Peregrinibacteria bacterium RIFOXYC2_FULL_33_13]|nr:MAG: hypothetical protein UR27_C0002G0058 [Candidatus Peregrinibacteria bacterium GW2011_GWA2_33_10]KKP41073.1 MAG: membrane protein [Candidatus Peregrinibacteria bacterium GW2011_GWC2_33_13]OGJ54261.1 MAG: hypothetical protein A2483_04955 [Candidatus Peregrinibacteria bacterium RIFOXYC2_FULL_33_13]
MERNHQVVKDLQKYFLLGTLILLIIVLFIFVSSFLSTLFIAAIIATAINPVHNFLQIRLKFPKILSAILTTLFVFVVIDGILALFFVSFMNQATDAYKVISEKVATFETNGSEIIPQLEKYPWIYNIVKDLQGLNFISTNNFISVAGDFVGTISGFLLENTKNLLKHLSVIAVHLLIFILAIFYFLKEGKFIVNHFKSLLPLSPKFRDELMEKIYQLMKALIFGVFGAAIIQGFLVGIALFVGGVNNSVFWGGIAALLSPVPYLGTSIVWLPFAISFFATGKILAGVLMLIWGLVVVSLSDNLVKPYLIGSSAELHPLAVLLVILGGVFAFGFQGLIFGPLILTLTLAFLHIYELEYQEVLNPHEEINKT